MLGLGPTELLLILALVLIIFGAGKLPQVFGSLGHGIKEFRQASEEPVTTVTRPVETVTTATRPAESVTTTAGSNGTTTNNINPAS